MLSIKVQFVAAAIIKVAGIVEAGVLKVSSTAHDAPYQTRHSQVLAMATADALARADATV